MGIKTKARMALDKFVHRYGYALKKLEPEKYENPYAFVMQMPKVEFSKEDFEKRDERISLSWVIPALGPGSGGHLDILRAVKLLTGYGIHNKIYIYNGNLNIPSEELKKTVKDYYNIVLDDEEIYTNIAKMTYSDGVVATSWQTAYMIKDFNNCVSKFYFVQDFEPYFYPHSSAYSLAENTYKMGFRGITAGNWLAEKLAAEYGMETVPFRFSYERDIYHKVEKKDDKKRIFFYARPYTERRAFEIGILALEELAKRMPDIEVITAGQSMEEYGLHFPYVDKGIMKVTELSDTYSQCDICLVLSLTNLSLLPLEVMASNSVVMSNKGPNNEWLVNDENSIMVDADPMEIADKLAYYLDNPKLLAKKREVGYAYANQFTWEEEIKKVYDFVDVCVKKDIADKV